jgi:hypothetical protein
LSALRLNELKIFYTGGHSNIAGAEGSLLRLKLDPELYTTYKKI